MAIEHPDAHVTGLDMADMFPTTIRPENVTFQQHNLLDGLPYDDNTFDFVHMRQLIVALRASEWPAILVEIRRVLKPGGLVQLMESDFTVRILSFLSIHGTWFVLPETLGRGPIPIDRCRPHYP